MMLSYGDSCKPANLLQDSNKYQDARKPYGRWLEVQPPAHSGGSGRNVDGSAAAPLRVITDAVTSSLL
jgi:hypothetical protein